MVSRPGRRRASLRRAARAATGVAAWGALPVLARRGLASVGSWREVLDPMVPVNDRLVAAGAAALLLVWLAGTGLVVLAPPIELVLRRARRDASAGARAGARVGAGAATRRPPLRAPLRAARGWLVALLLGGAAVATRAPVAAAAAPVTAELDATRDADRSRAPVGAVSVLTCGLVASAVLTRLHRARLRGARLRGARLYQARLRVPPTTATSVVTIGDVDPSIRATEVRLRRHAATAPPDLAASPTVASVSERDPWSAVPIGLHGDAPVTIDCARGGTVVIEAAEAAPDVAAGVITALAGACGFACNVEVGSEGLRAMPGLVPVRVGGDLGDVRVVRVTRLRDARIVDVHLAPPTPSAADALDDRRAHGAPMATLREADGAWRLVERDLAIRPYRLTAADASGVARLEASPSPRLSSRRWASHDDWRVLVRTMGPVSVELADGSEVRFARPKSVELLAWLTHHRERPTRTAARTALWAVDVSDATVANVVSDARRSLARAARTDVDWIDRTYTERLTFDRRIVSDVDVLARALRTSRASPSAESVAHLDAALALVRDLPFAGSDYLWPDEEGLTSHAVHLIVSAARCSAEWHLDRGDATAVVVATGHGLRALRGDDDLIALRSRAMRLDRARAAGPEFVAR